jgi:hypothetical protein
VLLWAIPDSAKKEAVMNCALPAEAMPGLHDASSCRLDLSVCIASMLAFSLPGPWQVRQCLCFIALGPKKPNDFLTLLVSYSDTSCTHNWCAIGVPYSRVWALARQLRFCAWLNLECLNWNVCQFSVPGSSVVYRVIYFVCSREYSEVTLLLSTHENNFDLHSGDAERN